MSKIGKLPVSIPDGVTVQVEDGDLVVKGKRGELRRDIPRGFTVEIKDGELVVLPPKSESKKNRAMYGTIRVLIANMVKGVHEGWSKELELVGTGYRAEMQGKNLSMTVGFSHPVVFEPPEGIEFTVDKSIIKVEGNDKEVVGQVAANIRSVRPPEPYKGKGVRYKDEHVRRKPGKAAKAAGAV